MQAELLTAVLVAQQGIQKLREYRNVQAREATRRSRASAATRPGRFAKTRVHKASSAESILKHCLRQLGYSRKWKQSRLTGRQHLKLLEAIRQYGRAWMRHEAESFFQHYGVKDELEKHSRNVDLAMEDGYLAASDYRNSAGSVVGKSAQGWESNDGDRTRWQVRALSDRILSPLRRWFDRARQFVRELIFAGAQSMAGQDPLGTEETAVLDRQAQVQAEYLEGFRKEIEANPPPEIATPSPFPSEVIMVPETVPMSAAQAAARAELYGNSVWATTLNTGREIVKKQNVFDAERRVHKLTFGQHKPCETCLAESTKGWVPVGTLAEIGDSECMGNCDCYFEWMAPGGKIHVSPWGRHNPRGYNIPGAPGTKLPGIAYPPDVKPPPSSPPAKLPLPRFGPTNAQIVTDPNQNPLKIGKAIVGKDVSLKDLASASGATDSATVYINASGHRIELSVLDPRYTAARILDRDKDGSLTIKAEGFHVQPEHQGKGIGAEVFGRMVETGERVGVDRITTNATRSVNDNGYYTWPRFGYDGPLENSIKDKLPPTLKSAKTVQDLFTSQEGREWWKLNGETMEMTFDLKPDSLSRQRWEAYIRAKLEQSNVTSPSPISSSPTKLGPGISKEPRIKIGPAKGPFPPGEGGDYEYWEAE